MRFRPGLDLSTMDEVRRTGRLAPVLGIALGWAGLNGLWWWWNTAPPAWDQTDYLLVSLRFFDAFSNGGFLELYRTFLQTTGGFGRPPLLSLLPLPLYGLAGTGPKVAQLVLLVFIPLLLLSLYGIGRRLGGEGVGLAACLVVVTVPHLTGLSRQFFVEFPLAALVAASIYLLLRLRDEERLWLYAGLAASIAVGMMLKVTYILFVGPAGLVVAAGTIHRGRVRGLLALVGTATVGLALASVWYMPNWHRVLWDIRESGYGIEAEHYGYGGPVLFLGRLVFGGLSLYYTALLLVLAIRCRGWITRHLRRGMGEGALLLVAWVAVPLLVFIFAVGRDPRYFLPSLPAASLGIGLLLVASRDGKEPHLFHFAYPLVAMLVVSFLPLSAFPTAQRAWGARLYQLMGSSYQNPTLDRGNWKADAIVELIWQMGKDGRHPVRTAVLANHSHFHVNLFNYAAHLKGKPMVFVVCEDTTSPFSADRCLRRIVVGSDFLLDKTGKRTVAGPDRYGALLDGWMEDRCLPFRPVPLDLSLPDGSSVRLWRKTAFLPAGSSPCLVPDKS